MSNTEETSIIRLCTVAFLFLCLLLCGKLDLEMSTVAFTDLEIQNIYICLNFSCAVFPVLLLLMLISCFTLFFFNVCVLLVIKGPAVPPCVVDGRYRNPIIIIIIVIIIIIPCVVVVDFFLCLIFYSVC